MFRYRITAGKESDVEQLLTDLRARLHASRLSAPSRALAAAEAEAVLRSFVDNGLKLAASGGNFEASRDIKGQGYAIHIAYSPHSRSFLRRLFDWS